MADVILKEYYCSKAIILEGEKPKGVLARIESVLSVLDTEGKNTRLYPLNHVGEALTEVLDDIKRGAVYVHDGHVSPSEANMGTVAGILKKVWVEGNLVKGVIDLRENGPGQDALDIINAGGGLFFSSVARGKVKFENFNGKDTNVVQKGWKYERWDIVMKPSFVDAAMYNIQEGLDNFDKILEATMLKEGEDMKEEKTKTIENKEQEKVIQEDTNTAIDDVKLNSDTEVKSDDNDTVNADESAKPVVDEKIKEGRTRHLLYIDVEQADNGAVVIANGKKVVFESTDSASEYVKTELKKKYEYDYNTGTMYVDDVPMDESIDVKRVSLVDSLDEIKGMIANMNTTNEKENATSAEVKQEVTNEPVAESNDANVKTFTEAELNEAISEAKKEIAIENEKLVAENIVLKNKIAIDEKVDEIIANNEVKVRITKDMFSNCKTLEDVEQTYKSIVIIIEDVKKRDDDSKAEQIQKGSEDCATESSDVTINDIDNADEPKKVKKVYDYVRGAAMLCKKTIDASKR